MFCELLYDTLREERFEGIECCESKNSHWFLPIRFREFLKINIFKNLPELYFTNYIHKINFFCLNFISRNSNISFNLLNKMLGLLTLISFLLKTTILYDHRQRNIRFLLDICLTLQEQKIGNIK